MKYPYIGKWEYINTTVIFTGKNAGIEMGGEISFRDDWAEINYENITAEYLANTYGEVKSKDHAEFIVKLAEVNGIPCGVDRIDMDYKVFYVIHGYLFFFVNEVNISAEYKQITIPLPPECESVDEWPKIGDEVQTSDGIGTVKLLTDSKGYYVISIKDDYYQYQLDELSKPKTPDQELRDELVELTLSHMENKEHPIEANAYYLVSEIIEKYIKNPQ